MNRTSPFRSLFSSACLIVFFVTLGGCGTLNLDSTSDARVDSLGTTSGSLRSQLISAAYLFSTVIESAADSIIDASSDSEVHRHAMMWKIYGIPRSRQALLHSDPLGGMYDGWTFAVQMRLFFETGGGADAFGSAQPIAIRASRRLSNLFSSGLVFITDSLEYRRLTNAVEEWAADHPIANLHFDRASIIPVLATLVQPEDKSAITALGAIARNVDDLTMRLNLYAAQTPTEARWQAEYLLLDLDAQRRLDSLAEQTETLLRSLDAMTDALVSGKVAIDVPSLQAFHGDLQSLTDLVRIEREIVLLEVGRQRRETLATLDSIIGRTIQEAGTQSLRAVDHLALRVAQLLVAIGVLTALIMIVRYMSRRSSTR